MKASIAVSGANGAMLPKRTKKEKTSAMIPDIAPALKAKNALAPRCKKFSSVSNLTVDCILRSKEKPRRQHSQDNSYHQ